MKNFTVTVETRAFIMGGPLQVIYKNIVAKNAGDAVREVMKLDNRYIDMWPYFETKEQQVLEPVS